MSACTMPMMPSSCPCPPLYRKHELTSACHIPTMHDMCPTCTNTPWSQPCALKAHPQSLHGLTAPQMHPGPNRHVTSPHASHTTATITSGHPCVSATPSPPYLCVTGAVCPRPVPHLTSTCIHMSPHVSMAPRHAWAPNDAPRPTANMSHVPYSRTCPKTTPYVILALPHTLLTLCPRRVPPPYRIRTPLRKNVLFGHADDKVRFRMVMRADAGPGDAPTGGPHREWGEGHQSQVRASVVCDELS